MNSELPVYFVNGYVEFLVPTLSASLGRTGTDMLSDRIAHSICSDNGKIYPCLTLG
jgi:hypothetical protein